MYIFLIMWAVAMLIQLASSAIRKKNSNDNDEPDKVNKRRKVSKVLLIVSTIIYAVALIGIGYAFLVGSGYVF